MPKYYDFKVAGSAIARYPEFQSSLRITIRKCISVGRNIVTKDIMRSNLSPFPLFQYEKSSSYLLVLTFTNLRKSFGWISEEKMCELAKPMLKNQYGQYLLKVIDEMKEEINSNTLQHI